MLLCYLQFTSKNRLFTYNRAFTLHYQQFMHYFYRHGIPSLIQQPSYQKAHNHDIDHLLQLMHSIYPLSEALRAEMGSNLVSLELEKDAVLIGEGDTGQFMYFIISGALMGLFHPQGKKIITYVSVENEFVSSISGLHGMRPSREGIVAVEHTRLWRFRIPSLLGLFEKYFDFNYIFRVMVQKYYQDAQERSHIIRVGNAEERYLVFYSKCKPGFYRSYSPGKYCVPARHETTNARQDQKAACPVLKKDEETEMLCKRLGRLYPRKTKPYQQKDLKLSWLAQAITLHRINYHSCLIIITS